MWEKEAECPSISMYSALIRCSLSFLGEMFFSLIRDLSVLSSASLVWESSIFLYYLAPFLLALLTNPSRKLKSSSKLILLWNRSAALYLANFFDSSDLW